MSLSESKESNVVSRSKDDSKDKKYHHLGSKDNVRGQHPSVIEKRSWRYCEFFLRLVRSITT